MLIVNFYCSVFSAVVYWFAVTESRAYMVNCSCMKLRNQRTKMISLTARLHLQSLAKQSRLQLLMERTGECVFQLDARCQSDTITLVATNTVNTLNCLCACVQQSPICGSASSRCCHVTWSVHYHSSVWLQAFHSDSVCNCLFTGTTPLHYSAVFNL